ncbi:vacuolar protein sorting 55 family protein [Heterostelium album PN500]|uniref:Vacuolar protein sorting 55 family protein n=1 Tax=Heterostelium pallidum (strain ATCC 26659 / Pp 5 / PN500) TaxID=670386 RepID=D3B637_HETP5|nr:vacuolar protein sorting 55 family protein [Heterostelium album PN500]EFA83335.1 vacuolar protein sorting 55 family protein [Heterostelium album PN500]|eukprot:XP_020435452.1 vacuolar protein sorting 55 family protein [Heterostelium album PN500]
MAHDIKGKFKQQTKHHNHIHNHKHYNPHLHIQIIGFSCAFAVGLLMNILACVFSHSGWPIIVVASYFLAPFPNLICKNRDAFSSESGNLTDLGMFLTGFFVISGFAIPAIMAHSSIITYESLGFAIAGGVTVYATLIAFMAYFHKKDEEDGWN